MTIQARRIRTFFIFTATLQLSQVIKEECFLVLLWSAALLNVCCKDWSLQGSFILFGTCLNWLREPILKQCVLVLCRLL
eukprot:COSAG02_NODE_7546_length_2967_cov_4.622309_4_plen_79_part_00